MGRLVDAQVTHNLHPGLDDKGQLAKVTGIDHPMIALVGGHKVREALAGGCPVKGTAVHNHATHLQGMAVHVLGGGVNHNVRTPLQGLAQGWRGKGVVHHQGNSLLMGSLGKALDVQHSQGRIGDGLAEYQLGVLADGLANLTGSGIGGNPVALDAQPLQGDGQQVDDTAIDGGHGNDTVPRLAQVQDGAENGSLAAGGQHGTHTTLQGGNLLFHRIAGGVCKAGIHEFRGHVEQVCDMLGGVKAVGGALHDGNHPGLPVLGCIACVEAFCLYPHAQLLTPHPGQSWPGQPSGSRRCWLPPHNFPPCRTAWRRHRRCRGYPS